MTAHSDDEQSFEGFDDILFSSDQAKGSTLIENEGSSVADKKTSSSFTSGESFDDILFGDSDTVEKAFEAAALEKKAAVSANLEEMSSDNIELSFSDDKVDKLDPPVIPIITSANSQISKSSKNSPSVITAKATSGQVTGIDEPISDDSFLEGALFSDESDIIDEPVNRQVTQDESGEASDDAELMQDALFSSTEDFEQATDKHPGTVVEKKKVTPKPKIDEHVVIPAININFQSFLSKSSQADAFVGKTASLQKQLIAENDAINDSFPLIEVDPKQFKERTSELVKKATDEENSSKISLLTRKAKRNMNEFLGGEIEERDINLDFKFPRQQGKKEVGEAPNKRGIQAYLEKKGAKTLTLLKRSEADISLISKHNLSASERERLLEVFLPVFYKKIPQLIASFERKPFDPQNIQRFEQLTLSLDSLKGLISGYKQIYSEFYQMNNFNYKRKQNEANQCAYELVQLLYLEMRLMQASKIPVPASSIKSINKIALVLKRYESSFFKSVQNHPTHSAPKSIETLWKKYQLYLCFDHLSVSSKLNQAIDAYLDYNVLDKVTVVSTDEVQFFPQSQWLYIQDNTDKRGRFLLLEDMNVESANEVLASNAPVGNLHAMMAVSDLFNQIKADYQDCFLLLTGAKKHHGCEAINNLSKEDTLCLFSFLNQQIEIIEENNKKPFYSIYKPVELEIRTGLESISDYHDSLFEQWQEDLKGPQGGPQKKNTQFGHKGWGIANENDEYIYLQGTLQASTPYLDCGEVICISRKDEKANYTHELAVIKELNLSNLHQPQLVAAKIATDVASLFPTNNFKPDHGRESMINYPVLEEGLLCKKVGQSYLLTPTESKLASDELLRIALADGSNHIIKTYQLHFISPSAMLFSLS